jgi:phosphoglycerate kinase
MAESKQVGSAISNFRKGVTMNKKTIRNADLSGKRVLVRVDFNVPVQDGDVQDDTRVRAAIPTLQYILEQKPRALTLMSHLGRPDGEVDLAYSMRPVAAVISQLLGVEVAFAEDCIGTQAESALANLADGGVLLLENTRFHAGETKNDPDMAAQLARLGDIFVNDAFGTAHRAHASTVGVTEHLEAVAGFLMEKEIDFLVNAIENPVRPFVAIMGGAKISDKVKVIEALLARVDKLLIGGGMGITFRRSQGYEVANSLVDKDALPIAEKILAEHGDKIVLPTEVVIADDFSNDANRQTIDIEDGVPDGWEILDVGQATIDAFSEALQGAKMVVWNGPLGVFEMPNFAVGTYAIANELVKLTEKGATTVIGGGESASAITQAGLADKISHVSTGGGASLELLEGRELPGVVALADL